MKSWSTLLAIGAAAVAAVAAARWWQSHLRAAAAADNSSVSSSASASAPADAGAPGALVDDAFSSELMSYVQLAGWHASQFEIAPVASKAQLGVIAKGAQSHAAFLRVRLLDSARDHPAVLAAVRRSLKLASETFLADPFARTVVTVGVRPSLWAKWQPDSSFAAAADFADVHDAHGSPHPLFPAAHDGDVLLMARSFRLDLCYDVCDKFLRSLSDHGASLVASYQLTFGFRFRDGRDLTEFIDGSRQPTHSLRAVCDVGVVHARDDASAGERLEGSSFAYLGKFVHDLDKFRALSVCDKSRMIGRDFTAVHVAHGGVVENPQLENAPEDAHINRGYGAMYRQAYPFVENNERGLMFAAFSRSLDELRGALFRMAGRTATGDRTDPPRAPDRLMHITRAIENAFFFCPSVPQLEALA